MTTTKLLKSLLISALLASAAAHAVEAEMRQRTLDRRALRVGDPVAQLDLDHDGELHLANSTVWASRRETSR